MIDFDIAYKKARNLMVAGFNMVGVTGFEPAAS